MRYRYNPKCSCSRCRAHGYTGPVVLITIGVLFLLSQVTSVYWLGFDHTWPALLIVIGLIMFLKHNASDAGHVPREYVLAQPVQPVPGVPVVPYTPPVTPPPPVPPAGSLMPPDNRGGA